MHDVSLLLRPRLRSVSLLSLCFALIGCGESTTLTPTTDAGSRADARPSTADSGPTGAGSIVDVASADGRFATLLAAATRAGLADDLAGPGPFTVFAPTDAAFEALGVDLATLSDAQLAEILSYHVVSGEVRSSAIPARADSINELTLFFDTEGGVSVNDADVIAADVDADNGVIHVINGVLLPPDIVDAAGYAGLTQLAAAATSAGLVDELQGTGPFTVLAPTDAAFEALPAVPAGDALAQVLLYHVLSGEVASSAIPARADSLATNEWGNGLTLLFSTTGGVRVNGVDVVVADVRTTNGIVHVIDEVLLPPNVIDMAGIAGLTGLAGAIGAAAPISGSTTVASALQGSGPFTVFAPTNEAFTAASSVIATLSAEQIRDVLLFHVVGGSAPVLSTGLAAGAVPTLLSGQAVDVAVSPRPTVEGRGIVAVDIHVTNGVIHLIDGVMVP